MTTMLEIVCRDPLVARDGRPFGAGQGNRMRGLDWLLPSVLAGSLRSTLGKSANRDFSTEVAKDLLQIEIAGPFPMADGRLYLPAPADCVVHRQLGSLRAAPQPSEQGGCDWPTPGLQPVGLSDAAAPDDFKPEITPAWWPEDHYAKWLAGKKVTFEKQFLNAPEKVERTHVKLDPRTGAADEGDLFTTTALALTDLPRYVVSNAPRPSRFVAVTLAARVRASGWCGETAAKLDTFHPLGGERGLVHWKTTAETNAWNAPPEIRDALTNTRQVRMVLATPALFLNGWKPGWLNEQLRGTPPGASVVLRLVGISIQRWQAVSGWSLANLPGRSRGPKPVRRVVPSGGVYFFESIGGNPSDLADRWLESVSDDPQDQRDGFGLATWGTW